MSLKRIQARRVRLSTPAPINGKGDIGNEWNVLKVKDLIVLPDIRQARCVLDSGRVYVAVYEWYEVADEKEQAEYEGESQFKCPECGMVFLNSQGLGGHMAKMHPRARKQKDE